MPNLITTLRATAVILPLLLAGCTSQPVNEIAADLQSPGMLLVSADGYRDTFEAAADSLKAQGFIIDRRDYRFGTITTRPRTAPQIFEIWNRDNTTASQAVSATLNDQSRIARVTISRERPQSPVVESSSETASADYYLTVRVDIERTTDPNRRLTGSTHATSIVRPLDATPLQYEREGVYGKSTVYVERDTHFEARLLADINTRRATAPTEPLQNGQ